MMPTRPEVRLTGDSTGHGTNDPLRAMSTGGQETRPPFSHKEYQAQTVDASNFSSTRPNIHLPESPSSSLQCPSGGKPRQENRGPKNDFAALRGQNLFGADDANCERRRRGIALGRKYRCVPVESHCGKLCPNQAQVEDVECYRFGAAADQPPLVTGETKRDQAVRFGRCQTAPCNARSFSGNSSVLTTQAGRPTRAASCYEMRVNSARRFDRPPLRNCGGRIDRRFCRRRSGGPEQVRNGSEFRLWQLGGQAFR